MSEADLVRTFPNLSSTHHRITSQYDASYNCIAWAAEDDSLWWWPDAFGIYHWPEGVARAETVDAFIEAYATIGYEVCDNGDLEKSYNKLAIYIKPTTGRPSHAARQLDDGTWTSKLGKDIDIIHATTDGLNGQEYGHVSTFLKRQKRRRRR